MAKQLYIFFLVTNLIHFLKICKFYTKNITISPTKKPPEQIGRLLEVPSGFEPL